MSLTAGIDIGSITAKAALLQDGVLLGTRVTFTGYNAGAAGGRVFDELLAELGLGRAAVGRIVATGYGRRSMVMADRAVTEIMCHAAGVRWLDPAVRSLIDIGGQDSKAVVMDGQGRVANFTMNDKCAAGTGRFLEAMARALEVEVSELAALDARAAGARTVSSMCTVFAESEVVSLVASGAEVPEIVAGLHRAIAGRTQGLVRRIAPQLDGLEVAMSGGVARNHGVVRALSAALGRPVRVPDEPDTVGALGAALIARDRALAAGSPA
jgi:predicted CoA-substrate-specific enzyme activase